MKELLCCSDLAVLTLYLLTIDVDLGLISSLVVTGWVLSFNILVKRLKQVSSISFSIGWIQIDQFWSFLEHFYGN